MQMRNSRIGITKSIEGADPPRTFIGDTTTNIKRVASDTNDLVDVMSHEEVGTVNGHITGSIKGMLHQFAVEYRFVFASTSSFVITQNVISTLKLSFSLLFSCFHQQN